MLPHSSTLAWKIPWMEEPGRLQSMGSLRVGHDWRTSLSLFTFVHWRRKWQPTPVFLPGESQGRGSLLGCRLWGRTVGHNWSNLAAAAAAAGHNRGSCDKWLLLLQVSLRASSFSPACCSLPEILPSTGIMGFPGGSVGKESACSRQRSLVDRSPQLHEESDMTAATEHVCIHTSITGLTTWTCLTFGDIKAQIREQTGELRERWFFIQSLKWTDKCTIRTIKSGGLPEVTEKFFMIVYNLSLPITAGFAVSSSNTFSVKHPALPRMKIIVQGYSNEHTWFWKPIFLGQFQFVPVVMGSHLVSTPPHSPKCPG